MARSLYLIFPNTWKIVLTSALLTGLMSACFNKSVEFEAGWATRQIEGTMLNSGGEELEKDSFIMVLEYYSRFVQFEEEQILYVPQAKLIRPGKGGRFRINFDFRASAIETVFISSKHRMERFRFQRQMGIGELYYEAKMTPESNWREHLILEVSPFLENFILEPRYKLAPVHQLFIGEWLDRERENVQD